MSQVNNETNNLADPKNAENEPKLNRRQKRQLKSKSFLKALKSWYMNQLQSNPILTKAITSMVIGALGNVICQYMTKKPFNITDFIRFIVVNFSVSPIFHYWYAFLGENVQGSLQRVACDQLVFSPIFTIVFFVLFNVLKGQPGNIIPQIKQDYTAVLIQNYKIWPAAQFVNLNLIPQNLQVLFGNFIGLIWNVYLSSKFNS